MSRSVQFQGADAVVRMYESRKVAAWSMGSASQLMFSYNGDDLEEGAELLTNILAELEQSGSPAVYYLKVHEDMKGDKITSKTPYHGSFNFTLSDNYRSGAPVLRGLPFDGARAVMDENAALKLRVKQLEDAEQDEDEMERVIGKVERVMEIPAVASIVGAFLSSVMGNKNMQAAISGLPEGVQELIRTESLEHSLRVLQQNDPNLEKHLFVLAKISSGDPEKFKGMLSMLDVLG